MLLMMIKTKERQKVETVLRWGGGVKVYTYQGTSEQGRLRRSRVGCLTQLFMPGVALGSRWKLECRLSCQLRLFRSVLRSRRRVLVAPPGSGKYPEGTEVKVESRAVCLFMQQCALPFVQQGEGAGQNYGAAKYCSYGKGRNPEGTMTPNNIRKYCWQEKNWKGGHLLCCVVWFLHAVKGHAEELKMLTPTKNVVFEAFSFLFKFIRYFGLSCCRIIFKRLFCIIGWSLEGMDSWYHNQLLPFGIYFPGHYNL